MLIELIDETERVSVEYQELVSEMIEFAANFLEFPKNRECSVTFVDNARIQEINREFRNIDKPTDVISFALDDNEEDQVGLLNLTSIDDQFVWNIGDIVISIDRAKEQAEDYGHSLKRELGFLAVHGFLHLIGYDHMTKEEELEMFGLQNQIFEAYGLSRDE